MRLPFVSSPFLLCFYILWTQRVFHRILQCIHTRNQWEIIQKVKITLQNLCACCLSLCSNHFSFLSTSLPGESTLSHPPRPTHFRWVKCNGRSQDKFLLALLLLPTSQPSSHVGLDVRTWSLEAMHLRNLHLNAKQIAYARHDRGLIGGGAR